VAADLDRARIDRPADIQRALGAPSRRKTSGLIEAQMGGLQWTYNSILDDYRDYPLKTGFAWCGVERFHRGAEMKDVGNER